MEQTAEIPVARIAWGTETFTGRGGRRYRYLPDGRLAEVMDVEAVEVRTVPAAETEPE